MSLRTSVLGRVASIGAGGRHESPVPIPDGRRPTVSVVVPCYNYGHFLPACVQSLLDQSDQVDVDVLIVDDASPDGSGQIALALADADERVHAIVHEVNAGHIRTYNEGLAKASGDYVVLLSADDLLPPGALGRAVAVMEAHPEVGLVYGRPVVFETQPPPAATKVRDWTIWSGPDWVTAQVRRGTSIIYSPEAVVRTSVQHQVGGYDVALPHTGDLDMWLRIAAVAGVARVNGPDQAYRREHAASMMHTTFAAALADLEGRRAAYEGFFDGPGANLPERDAQLALANQRLAQQALDHACVALRADAARERESGHDVVADVDAYADFACALGADERLWQWREYEALRRVARRPGGGGRSAAAVALAGGLFRTRRDLEGRLRWQRWDWSGV